MTTQMEIGPAEVQPKKRRRRGDAWDFMVAANAWCLANADRLARMHVLHKDGVFHMYIIPKSMPYDPELTRSHSRFGIELWDKYRISGVGQQIPDTPTEDLAAYFDPTGMVTLTPV